MFNYNLGDIILSPGSYKEELPNQRLRLTNFVSRLKECPTPRSDPTT